MRSIFSALFLIRAAARMLPQNFEGRYEHSESSLPTAYKRPYPSISSGNLNSYLFSLKKLIALTILDLDPNPDNYIVSSLPGLKPKSFPTKQWAGQIPIPYAGDQHYGGLFFWLFEPNISSSVDKSRKPLIVWLNGGPGCSSMDGLFIENGPFRVLPNWTVGINNYSWHNEGYLLFIDQPIGTGFSYVNRDCHFCDFVHNQVSFLTF